jgi:hypothetical protein
MNRSNRSSGKDEIAQGKEGSARTVEYRKENEPAKTEKE